MSARDRILERVRSAVAARKRVEHPGDFGEWRPSAAPGAAATRAFDAAQLVEELTDRLADAGAEFIQIPGHAAASAWARNFANHFDTVAISRIARWPMGDGAPEGQAWIDPVGPEDALLGISMAHGAVAETGSLILSAFDGRRGQLLPPVHLVWLDAARIYPTLREALADLRAVKSQDVDDAAGVDLDAEITDGLPSAIALHSGPSKSADIGQVLVKGVHGPGRLVVLIVGGEP